MHARTALAAALAIGLAVAPAALAQHGHGHHGDGIGAHARTTGAGRYGRDGASAATETRTVTLHAIITGAVTETSVVVTPAPRRVHGHRRTSAPITVLLDTNTTFSTLSNPTASWSDLTEGDEVAVTWTVPAGTRPSTVAATSVADLGAPPPVRYVVHGITTDAGTISGVTITTTVARRHHHDRRGHITTTTTTSSTTVDVSFDGNTVFVNAAVPVPTWANIASGDRVTIVWMAPPDTALANLPAAAKVIDQGPPPPIRYRADGTATTPGTDAGVTLSVKRIHPNVAPALATGASLNVTFGASTLFFEVGDPGATVADILPGDRLLVIWTAPPGTAATNLPDAAGVYDLGQPTP